MSTGIAFLMVGSHAVAQDVVMRRPLPNASVTSTPDSTPPGGGVVTDPADPDPVPSDPVDPPYDPNDPDNIGPKPVGDQNGWASWQTEEWQVQGGAGGGQCGSLTHMTRSVSCMGDIYDADWNWVYSGVMARSMCLANEAQPASDISSTEVGCYSWTLGEFSPWSSTCGFASHSAEYSCTDQNGDVVPDAKCMDPNIGQSAYKPDAVQDYSNQTSGCARKLAKGDPVIGSCVGSTKSVTYPNAVCAIVDRDGYALDIDPDMAACGGAPAATTISCSPKPMDPSDANFGSCMWDPYNDRYRGEWTGDFISGGESSGNNPHTLDPSYVSSVVNDVCSQGAARGFECCVMHTADDGASSRSFVVEAFHPKPSQFVTCSQSPQLAYDELAEAYGEAPQIVRSCVIYGTN